MYNAELQDAMRTEMQQYATALVLDGAGTFSALLTSTQTSLNQPLSALYGVTGIQGNTFASATLDATQRGGLLTLTGFLANAGAAETSAPSRRGKVILNRFLCEELEVPPVEIPAPDPPSPGLSTRQRFEEHGQNACAIGCHVTIDGIGFAFEHYDGIGGYRETDMNVPVDSASSLELGGTVVQFANAMELGQLLAGEPEAHNCFTRQWLRYAFRRLETDGDLASIQSAEAAFNSTNGNVRDLIVALVKSRTFRYRAPAAGEVLQ
jgi:hypothetical protein